MELPRLGLNRNNKSARDFNRVTYMDTSALQRPFDMPWLIRLFVLAFVVAGAIIGAVVIRGVYDLVVLEPQRELESIRKNLARDVPLQLPVLTRLIQLDEESVYEVLENEGYITFDMNSLGGIEGTGIDMVKLPDGVSLMDAGIAYAKGLSKIPDSEAILMINGSWRFSVLPGSYADMKVKYADFKSGSIDAAINYAIREQGLADSEFRESGIDSAGNTYQTGVVYVNGTMYRWQVSACPLNEVYSISELPEDSVYVGIRLFL